MSQASPGQRKRGQACALQKAFDRPMILCFGVNETARLGQGWHEREAWGEGLTYRWTTGRAAVGFEGGADGRTVRLLASAPASAVGPVTLTARFGEEGDGEAVAFRFDDDRWRLVEFQAPADGANRESETTLRLRVAPTFVPDRALGNGDHRELGLRVAALHIV